MKDGFNLQIHWHSGHFSVWSTMRDQEEVDFVLPVLESIRAKIAQTIEARRVETPKAAPCEARERDGEADAPNISGGDQENTNEK